MVGCRPCPKGTILASFPHLFEATFDTTTETRTHSHRTNTIELGLLSKYLSTK